jgi:AAA15 family ATPase/GTPase
MIEQVSLRNFGPLQSIGWNNLGGINLVIGSNGSGKTFLLKAIYSAIKTLEKYKRGDDKRHASVILAEKLYWTFQAEKIGDLTTKRTPEQLSFSMSVEGKEFTYKFGKDTESQISSLENHVSPRESNSVFIPAKEILSIHRPILKSRGQDQAFGFDDTYYDLANVLMSQPQRGKNYKGFAAARTELEKITGGKIEFDESTARWQYRDKDRRLFTMGVTAEGIKKISIFDTLLGNRYLDDKSIVFIDELESALHPSAISKFLDIIASLAEMGLQFFIASHSYFVVKKLYLLAHRKRNKIDVTSAGKLMEFTRDNHWNSVQVLSLGDGGANYSCHDLRNGMPDNPIIDESIRLYEEETELAFK